MTLSAQPLGKIVLLQIQRASLKTPASPEARYDPVALWSAPDLTLTADGAETLLPNGDVVLDIHNALHSQTKNSKGRNDLSIGFTAHYAAMRDRFGPHLADGVAGENILVAIDRPVMLDEVAAGVVIETAGGRVHLQNTRAALPCSPFSKFAARSADPETVKGALQFLDRGMRGFYCAYEGAGPATIALGDTVWAASEPR